MRKDLLYIDPSNLVFGFEELENEVLYVTVCITDTTRLFDFRLIIFPGNTEADLAYRAWNQAHKLAMHHGYCFEEAA